MPEIMFVIGIHVMYIKQLPENEDYGFLQVLQVSLKEQLTSQHSPVLSNKLAMNYYTGGKKWFLTCSF